MKISFAVLGKESDVSGGYLYNQQIASSSNEFQLIHKSDISDFKNYLNDTHEFLLIDAWGLHGIRPENLKKKYYLLCHHPLALDESISGNQEKEIEFWNKAEGIIVTGHEVAKYVQSKTETPVVIVEPGIINRKKKSKIKGGDFEMIGIGSFIERKGDELLFEACSNVLLPFKLTRIGAVPDKEYLIRLKKKLVQFKLEEKVSILGQVSRETLNREMDRAFLALFPTRYESYGMAIQECLAAGIPVIASDSPGLSARFGRKGIRYVEHSAGAWTAVLNEFLGNKKSYNQLVNEVEENDFKFKSWSMQSKKIIRFLGRTKLEKSK